MIKSISVVLNANTIAGFTVGERLPNGKQVKKITKSILGKVLVTAEDEASDGEKEIIVYKGFKSIKSKIVKK